MTPLLQTQEFSSENGNAEATQLQRGRHSVPSEEESTALEAVRGHLLAEVSAPEEHSLVNNLHLPKKTGAVYLSQEAFTMRASGSQPLSTNSDFDS